MAAGVRSDCGDVDDDGTLLPPPSSSQPTCWELLSTDSKTPNPRPTKTMKMEESSNPPRIPPDLVDLEAPTPKVEEKPPTGEGEGRAAEPEKAALGDYDTDDDDMEESLAGFRRLQELGLVSDTEFVESDSETEEEKAFWTDLSSLPTVPKECDICFLDHYTTRCPYMLSGIPYGQEIPNSETYIILCPCGSASEDGGPCNNKNCVVRSGPRFVMHRAGSIYELKK